MALLMRRLARRNDSNNHPNHPHLSNGNNIDNHVKVLAMVLRTVSPNADNAHWRGIERGRMTFIMPVGSANPHASAVNCPGPSLHVISSFS
jgi:hypothetical protein